MAASSQVALAALNSVDYAAFKLDIITKISWKLSDWALHDQVGSNIHFFIKNIVHWFHQLTEVKFKRYLVVTTFSPTSKSRLSMLQILLAFKQQFGITTLSGSSESANRNFVVLHFASEKDRNFVLENFTIINNHFVVAADWCFPVKNIDFALNWLPADISLVDIQEELSKVAPITSLNKISLDLGDGDVMPTGKVVGTIHSSALSTLEKLPHILYVDSFKAHWIIYARKPLCLSCHLLGHMAAECPTPYCTVCRSHLPKGHVCNSSASVWSYAQIVKLSDDAAFLDSNSPVEVAANVVAPVCAASDLSSVGGDIVLVPPALPAANGLESMDFQSMGVKRSLPSPELTVSGCPSLPVSLVAKKPTMTLRSSSQPP